MRPIAAGALIVTLWCAPASAQTAQPPGTPEAPGVVEPPPILMPNTTMQLRNDLEILRAGLESYRAGHFYHYPSASTLEELIATLVHSEDVPAGFQLKGTVTEFVANRGGYRVSARTNGDVLTIRTPERYNPFWAMLTQPL